MENTNPSLAVIVVNWKSSNWTISCVNQLLEQTYRNIQIIIVDNGSGLEEVRTLRHSLHSSVELIELPKNTGFTGGNNAAMRTPRAQRADYVLLLNNDVRMNKDFISNFIYEAERQPIGIYGPLVMNWDSKTVQSCGSKYFDLWTGTMILRTKKSTQSQSLSSTFVSGCCMLIHSKVLRKIGYLDERYFLYYEETDYCIRALKNNYSVTVLPKVSIDHYNGGSSNGTNTMREKMLARNRVVLVDIHGSFAQRITIRIFMVLFYIPVRTLLLTLGSRSGKLVIAFWKGAWQGILYSSFR